MIVKTREGIHDGSADFATAIAKRVKSSTKKIWDIFSPFGLMEIGVQLRMFTSYSILLERSST